MDLQKWEPPKEEFRPSKNFELQKFEKAKAALKIGESGEEAIRQALRYAMVKIGLRGANFPKGIEKILLIRHVHENFPENTVDEIKIAFDWAIDGRLDVELNCFENFSCAYFSSIMKAYNRLANQVTPKPQEFKMIEDVRRDYDYEEFKKSDFAKKLEKNGIQLPK